MRSNFLSPFDQLPNLNQKQNLNELLVIKYLRIYKYSDIFPCGCCVSTLRKSSCINWRHVLKFILALLGDSDKVIHYIGSGGSCIIFSFCQLFCLFAHFFYNFRMLFEVNDFFFPCFDIVRLYQIADTFFF